MKTILWILGGMWFFLALLFVLALAVAAKATDSQGKFHEVEALEAECVRSPEPSGLSRWRLKLGFRGWAWRKATPKSDDQAAATV